MEKKRLMSHNEWEAVCERCARCCYEKVDFEGEIYYTKVPCQFLDLETNRCRVYEDRQNARPGCVHLDDDNVAKGFLPADCPYVEGVEGYVAPYLEEEE